MYLKKTQSFFNERDHLLEESNFARKRQLKSVQWIPSENEISGTNKKGETFEWLQSAMIGNLTRKD